MADFAPPTPPAREPDFASLLSEIRGFVAEREWESFHDPKNLAMAVASEAGELVAELRWVRGDQADELCREPETRERIADEVADVLITTLMLADRIGLDPVEVARRKMEKNRVKYPVEKARGRAEKP